MTTRIILRAYLMGVAIMLLMIPLAGCGEEPDAGPLAGEDSAPVPELPEQQFFNYRLVETNAGVPQWILQSDVMNKYSGQRDAELVSVHIDFYKEGVHFSTLTSDSGRANLQTKDIFAWGDVVVVNNDGRKLETEELYFDNKTQLIFNDVFDRFTRGDDVVEGIGLEAPPDLEYIEIKQRVEADVLDSEEPKGEPR
jgi:LPS export ABC transporter protein LptC